MCNQVKSNNSLPNLKRFSINLILIFNISMMSGDIYAQHLFINEILASNSTGITDPDFRESSDWLELYNSSEVDVNLSGYYLTDNPNDTTKWQIPNGTVLPANDYLIFYADGNDTSLTAQHTNFKLSKSGETIALYSPEQVLIDSITYTQQITDISYGRHPDGENSWQFFENPTPGRRNHSAIYLKADAPQFSLNSGYYTVEQVLEISASADEIVRYTLDCSEPTAQSSIYTDPLTISDRAGDPNYFSQIRTTLDPEEWLPDWTAPAGEVFKATVVRARAFRDGYQPSDIITRSYFVDANMMQRYPTIAVISLVSDYKHLFDDASGIYVPGITHRNGDTRTGNYFQDWERPAHIEFFEPGGVLGFAQDVGIRIQGGSSPVSPQKGLHVIADNAYGLNRIRYPIFKNTKTPAQDLDVFKRFMIRAWGSVISAGLFNDAYAQMIMADADLDIMAYRPVILFINGEYWGLHELREANKNSWYYQYHHDIDRDNPGIDLLEHRRRNGLPYASIDEGDNIHWNAMIDYLNTHDMSQSEHYNYIQTQMDIDNFICYAGHEIYFGNWDWPGNNEASWRPRTPDGRWRWIPFDLETSFGVATALGPAFSALGAQYNMLTQVMDGVNVPGFGHYGPQPVFAKLIRNDEFKSAVIEWFNTRMNTSLSPDSMNARLNKMIAEIEPYMPEYRQRWPFTIASMNDNWYYHLDLIRTFINNRPGYIRQHFSQRFGVFIDVPDKRESVLPGRYALMQNFPNPFNSSTTIEFELPQAGHVDVAIYNLLGTEIRSLNDSRLNSGMHRYFWDGKDNTGKIVSSGLYLLVLQTGEFKATRKIVMLK